MGYIVTRIEATVPTDDGDLVDSESRAFRKPDGTWSSSVKDPWTKQTAVREHATIEDAGAHISEAAQAKYDALQTEEQVRRHFRDIVQPAGPPAPQYPAWVQPTGAHDAYAVGDRVTHQGKVWESTVAGNVWAPGVSGWREVV